MAEKQFAFTDAEIKLAKEIFQDNDTMLYAIRNHMFQFDLTNEQKAALAMLSPQYKAFLRKVFVQPMDPTSGLGKLTDAWASIDTSGGPQECYPFILSRKKQLDYIEARLSILDGENVDMPFSFDDLRNVTEDVLETFVKIHTRKQLVQVIDAQLNLCKLFAGLKEETVEQTKERLMKDSSK